ncbi:hypothetical protein KU306_10480 [Haloferax larsenii]|uniref:Flagellar protein FlaF n=1 Tax=Haloferax larsenii TaxID=302484 RepID=A0ABY5RAG7_HALLR|nr:hypothetical protein [Haloferax larsenii]ELZ82923.1 hypothetical protein C455_02093 [Haloferax larsenii JCM 13917]UVE49349.1 hypothetical protein KU306_10480 [Haloferax larsenii]
MTTRGVSTTLGFVLTLTITAILVSGLMVAAGGFVSGERERITEAELEVIGQRLAANLEATDRVVAGSDDQTTVRISSRLELPPRVAGTTYRVTVEPDASGESELVLESSDPEITVRVPFVNRTRLAGSSVDGGDVVVDYDGTQLEVTDE